MPIAADWDAERGIWSLTTAAVFTLDEVAERFERTDWRGAKRYLWDLSALESGPGSLPELRRGARLADRIRDLFTGSRVAILVARDVDFGIARMFQTLAEETGTRFEVFRDREKAISWLLEPALR